MRTRVLVLGCLAVSVAVAACSDPMPEGPDTAALELAYTTPTATLQSGDAEELGPVFQTVTEVNEALGRDNVFMAGSIDATDDPSPETGETGFDRLDLEGNGFVRITHVCPGWPDDSERTRETTGAIETTVLFDTAGLDLVYWGVADRCKITPQGKEVLVDANLIVVRFGTGAIVSLEGLVMVDGKELVDGEVDYAITDAGLAYRHSLGERGHVIINVDLDGLLSVRAANGVFTCGSSCEPIAGAARLEGLR